MREDDTNSRNSALWQYIWLVYSVFYFIDPVLRHNGRFWIESLVIFVIFVAIYIAFNRANRSWTKFMLLGGMFLLGLLDYPRNEGATSFFIYAAAFLPFLVESVPVVSLLVLTDCLALLAKSLWVMRTTPGQHSLNDPINLGIGMFFVLVVGVINTLAAQQRRANERLQKVERENVQLAAIAERERIARDLHDVLGHTLSVIVLKAELAGRLVELDPQRAMAEIADVERTARTALTEVREAIGGYRSQGLVAEMNMARRALDAAGVVLTLEEIDAGGLPQSLDVEVQTMLSLTLREAVTNIVRHAHATHCRVSFTTTEGQHVLLIEDDGTHPAPCEGNGLRGMRERVQRMGGLFSLETDGGTKVRVAIPAAATVQEAN
ncbi:sensor histidine kinase [Granulicella arctica]|uniref:Two-component system sensor histidine kinase DesK n=1 Tax=Granulicella arctica TaxID=940613 RepID=A0A7Y9PF12_9BACT|nr:sensor histidine kinase [Granulicella arctica]NYF78479.1 two-component system sensor histidine kinase DesK [Granulicella arctica]